jgi:hypothetical protein
MVATRTTNGVKAAGSLTIGYLPASVYCFVIGRALVSRGNEAAHEAVRNLTQMPA